MFRPISEKDYKYIAVGFMFKLLDYHRYSFRIREKYSTLCLITDSEGIISAWINIKYPNLAYALDRKEFFLNGIWIKPERMLIQDYKVEEMSFECLPEEERLCNVSKPLDELEDYF